MNVNCYNLDIREYLQNSRVEYREIDSNYLFIDVSDIHDETQLMMAYAISLDIRGDYGVFLNRRLDKKTSDEHKYEWSGNLFHITVDLDQQWVELRYLGDEDDRVYTVDLFEWEQTLKSWKKQYLDRMGFIKFKTAAFNHFWGVIMLAYDSSFDKEEFDRSEILEYAIKRCASRFGVRESTIKRDCRSITGMYNIGEIYLWLYELFTEKKEDRFHDEFIKEHLMSFHDDYTLFEKSLEKYFNVEL